MLSPASGIPVRLGRGPSMPICNISPDGCVVQPTLRPSPLDCSVPVYPFLYPILSILIHKLPQIQNFHHNTLLSIPMMGVGVESFSCFSHLAFIDLPHPF